MTTDMFDWEEQPPKLQLEIAIGVYVWDQTPEQKPIITCGFLEDEQNNLFLPHTTLQHDQYAAHAALAMFREYVPVEPAMLDMLPYGFYDPINQPVDEMADRSIVLFYRTKIHPGMPVHPHLRFYTHEEIEVARSRIRRGHHAAYRAGVSG